MQPYTTTPLGAVVDGLLREHVAEHCASHRAARIDDEHSTAAGLGDEIAHTRVVFEALDGCDLAGAAPLAAVIAKQGFADLQLGSEAVAEVGSLKFHA